MTTTQYFVTSIAALVIGHSAFAIELPSNEELFASGRKAMGEVSGVMLESEKIKAQGKSGNTINQNSPSFKPIPNQVTQKDLMNDVYAASKKMQKTMDGKQETNAPKYELIVFVSFSMPDELLKEYSKQAREAGATIYLRGLYQNSYKKTQVRTLEVNPSVATWGVLPALYRKFHITAVPSIILNDTSSNTLEDGSAKEGDYLKVDGDVSIHEALVTMRRYGDGALAQAAADMVDKLERAH